MTLNTTSYNYDALGNIEFKSDVGSYLYGAGGAGPHAVTSAGAKNYFYDANGNLETVTDAANSALRAVAWSSFNKPVTVTDNTAGTTSSLVYGPGRGRIKQTIGRSEYVDLDYDGIGEYITATERVITYAGGLYEKHVISGQSDELVHYIRAGNTVAVFVKVVVDIPGSDRIRYLHRDHIGSVDLITGAGGAIVERRSYDSHGKPRAADWQPGSGFLASGETRRGFTGHEHLDETGLIHMNGRVYDPELGRFLSADPFVPGAAFTQAYNRYAYAINNPLSYTDPSGFFFGTINRGIGRAVGGGSGSTSASTTSANRWSAIPSTPCAPTNTCRSAAPSSPGITAARGAPRPGPAW